MAWPLNINFYTNERSSTKLINILINTKKIKILSTCNLFLKMIFDKSKHVDKILKNCCIFKKHSYTFPQLYRITHIRSISDCKMMNKQWFLNCCHLIFLTQLIKFINTCVSNQCIITIYIKCSEFFSELKIHRKIVLKNNYNFYNLQTVDFLYGWFCA